MLPAIPVLRRAILGLAALFLVGPVDAHQTAASRMDAQVHPDERRVDLLLAISAFDLFVHLELPPTEDPAESETVRRYLDRHLTVYNDGRRCPPAADEGFLRRADPATHVVYMAVAECEDPLGELTFENRVLVDTPGGYQHRARIQVGDDVLTTLFNARFSSYRVAVGPEGEAEAVEGLGSTLGRYHWEGILHILFGFDHVLFVAALLITARRLRHLIGVVTAFTLAHSVTLSLSALDAFTLSPAIVEPLIAVSIGYIAVENIRRPGGPRHRYWVTFGFGLIHGFGFSYVLRDELGLPTDALWPALMAFNLGVEVGQVAIVLAVFPLLRLAMRREGYRHLRVGASLVILGLSIYWLVARILEFHLS